MHPPLRSMTVGDNAAHPARAFFGRRKGHKLRPRQAQLFDTVLPRLAIDRSRPAPADLSALFPFAGRRSCARNRFRRRRIHDRAGQASSRTPASSASSLSSTAWPRRWPAIENERLSNIRLHFDDAVNLIAWLPGMSLARIDLIHPDPWPKRRHWKRRFVQDDMVAQLARILRPRRRIPLRDRYCRLRRLDAAAPRPVKATSNGRRNRRRRLAQSMAGIHTHALSRQGGARRTCVLFSDLPKALKRLRAQAVWRTCQKRTTRCAVEAESRP